MKVKVYRDDEFYPYTHITQDFDEIDEELGSVYEVPYELCVELMALDKRRREIIKQIHSIMEG